jgi:hypothetical protein
MIVWILEKIDEIETHLGRVHFVDGNNQLTDTEGESQEGVLAGLTILGNASLEFTSTTSNDENGAVSLGGTRNHVLDEITMARGVDDLRSHGSVILIKIRTTNCTHSNHELGGLELPKGDIDGDAALTLGL